MRLISFHINTNTNAILTPVIYKYYNKLFSSQNNLHYLTYLKLLRPFAIIPRRVTILIVLLRIMSMIFFNIILI